MQPKRSRGSQLRPTHNAFTRAIMPTSAARRVRADRWRWPAGEPGRSQQVSRLPTLLAGTVQRILARAVVSGTLAAAAVTVVASIASRRTTGSYPSAINATSHALWGDRAANHDDYSWKYTATGLVTNFVASVFWAGFYEMLGVRAKRRPGPIRDALRASGISAAAYITDYHLVSKRLTPGFELRLPAITLVPIYAALAVGLSIRDVLTQTRAGKGKHNRG